MTDNPDWEKISSPNTDLYGSTTSTKGGGVGIRLTAKGVLHGWLKSKTDALEAAKTEEERQAILNAMPENVRRFFE